MSYDPREGFPRVVPELVYKDVRSAIAWLSRVFGFRERLRWTSPNGAVGHADLELEGGVVMLRAGEDGYRNPADLGQPCQQMIVYVSDVNRHFAHARAEGASIISEPRDKPWGLRQYLARDSEGHVWEFTEHVRDVPPEAWGARSARENP